MNSRDPFNIRNNASPALNLLRNSARTAQQHAIQTSQKIVAAVTEPDEVGLAKKREERVPATASTAPSGWQDSSRNPQAATMSYALPQNGPTHRHTEQWSRFGEEHTANTNPGMGEKMSDMFGAGRRDSLPMYKDKPAGYFGATSAKRGMWYRRKRIVAAVLGSMAGLSWWFGVLSPLSYVSGGGQTEGGKSWSIMGGGKGEVVDWNNRADRVRDAFKISWSGYEKYAWGMDEYHPQSHGSRNMIPGGMGWIIVDALDTMMLMNLTTELEHARQWVHHNLTYDQDHDVNTFETTIRMLGGLLSAHYLSTSFPGTYAPVSDSLSSDLYIEKAVDLADRLLGAYDSPSGIPYASVNLHTQTGIPSHDDGGASSTAEATSLQLEMKYLSKLTGETNYWTRSEKVLAVVDGQGAQDGLLPIFLYADNGQFRGNNIRLGSRGDSYYEYLPKQYLQTSQQEPIYQALWNESWAGVKKHLLTYSYPSNFTVLAERPTGLEKALSPKMDHLVCFMSGTIALATTNGLSLKEARALPTWSAEQEEDMRLADELMKTCWGMYKVTPTGLAPEIAHFNIHDPALMYSPSTPPPPSPAAFDPPNSPDANGVFVGKDDFIIKPADSHNLQRPETVESLFYMWRITGDEKYRQWGWEMFQSFVQWTGVEGDGGFTSLGDVMKIPPGKRDNMESFWMAETLKYFYLLFADTNILPLTDVVLNTEAHAFPKFQMGKLFTTGWERKPRDSDGKIIEEIKPKTEGMSTVRLTTTVVRESEKATELAGMVTRTDVAEALVAEATGEPGVVVG